jgi:hypothetical protein
MTDEEREAARADELERYRERHARPLRRWWFTFDDGSAHEVDATTLPRALALTGYDVANIHSFRCASMDEGAEE